MTHEQQVTNVCLDRNFSYAGQEMPVTITFIGKAVRGQQRITATTNMF